MKLIKTVKYFVSGSWKYFDLYKCTWDNVDESTDSKHRKQISITIGEDTFTGLHNSKVLEHLQANEGTESFVVLWKSTKGNYLLAYSWQIWEDYINGVATNDFTKSDPIATDHQGESFVYMWVDMRSDKKYIGKHKGTPDDGYIGSGQSFLEEYNAAPEDFIRTILAYGTDEDMHNLETMLILQLNASKSPMYYNLSNNLRK